MTENEAIKIIKYYCPKKKKFNCGIFTEVHDTECNFGQALNVAIAALEEVQQYREIGTVEECREAMEKQRPKNPDYEGDGYTDGYMVYDTWICPNCGTRYEVGYDSCAYCPECGKQIDVKTALDLAIKGKTVMVLVPGEDDSSWKEMVPDTLQHMLEGCMFFRQEPAMEKDLLKGKRLIDLALEKNNGEDFNEIECPSDLAPEYERYEKNCGSMNCGQCWNQRAIEEERKDEE